MNEKLDYTKVIPVLGIFFVALVLRIWKLDQVPPGLTHDEANNVCDAISVLKGERPFYFPVAQGKEPLYPYSVAAVMAVVGQSVWAMRLTSILWGLLLIPITFIWIKRVFGYPVALFTIAGLAIGFWPVATARMGLRAISLPALLAISNLFLWIAVFGKGQVWKKVTYFTISGGFFGLCLYTYLASRLMVLVPLYFFAYLLLLQRDQFVEEWRREDVEGE